MQSNPELNVQGHILVPHTIGGSSRVIQPNTLHHCLLITARSRHVGPLTLSERQYPVINYSTLCNLSVRSIEPSSTLLNIEFKTSPPANLSLQIRYQSVTGCSPHVITFTTDAVTQKHILLSKKKKKRNTVAGFRSQCDMACGQKANTRSVITGDQSKIPLPSCTTCREFLAVGYHRRRITVHSKNLELSEVLLLKP